MNRQGPTVTLFVGKPARRVWSGPLRRFLDDNDMSAESVRGIARQLRRYGNAIVGGGAAGDSVLRLKRRRARA